MSTGHARLHARDVLALLPLWLVPLLQPFGRTAEAGTLLAITGLAWLLARHGRDALKTPAMPLLLLVFAAYLGAALLSATDAILPTRSWQTCLGLLRFAVLGAYAAAVLVSPARLRATWFAAAIVALWWTVDAWLQICTGWSLGGPPEAERITGIFGAGDVKLGVALAALAPFVLWAAREWRGRTGLIAAFLLLLVPLLLAGERQAWLSYALVAIAFIGREARTPQRFIAGLGATMLVVALVAGVAWQTSPRFEARLTRSLQAFGGNHDAVNTALSGRLDIWRTAFGIYATHLVNGVGVRDFRHAYPAQAGADDHFVVAENCGSGTGACHPHQWLLEVASETGTLGLALWFGAIALAWRAWRRAAPAARTLAFPAGVALVSVLFPLNTHFAFYSAWWGLLFWWLLAVWCAAISGRKPEQIPAGVS